MERHTCIYKWHTEEDSLSFSFIFECYSMWFKGFCFSKSYFTYSICIFICCPSPVRRVDQSLPTASANICMMYRKILNTLKTLFCTKQQPLQLKIQTNYNTNECSFSGGRTQFYLYNTKSQQQSSTVFLLCYHFNRTLQACQPCNYSTRWTQHTWISSQNLTELVCVFHCKLENDTGMRSP